MNNEKKNNGRGIFYGVIGVATLVVAIIGATFAYFTATANNNNTITGNMLSVTFNLNVAKVTHVDESKGGMIPMSNNMVEAAVVGTDSHTCVDNNGNAVCQIYKITVTNTGSAGMFVDGFVSLTGGSGTPTDVAASPTTMRWAQVFCTGSESDEITGCSTSGTTTTGASGIGTFTAIGVAGTADPHNLTNIQDTYGSITSEGTINSNAYDIIDKNYIRTSQHTAGQIYDRNSDVTSALVYNQSLTPASNDTTTDEAVLYIVVWLSENGHDQTATATTAGNPASSGLSFFNGEVVFNSAQGAEVTATFNGYTAVPSDTTTSGTNNG